MSGLSRGDWNDTEIFFRGNGDIIGANRIDEKLLEEMRKRESLDAAVEEVRTRGDAVVSGLTERADDTIGEEDLANDTEPDLGSLVIDQGVDE